MEICKYCLDNQSTLCYPCNCKNPVCHLCIEMWIRFSHRENCEICQSKILYQVKKKFSLMQFIFAVNEDIDNSLFLV